MNKLVCIVGMAGAGKSLISDALVKRGYGFVRFGQLTLDIVKERGIAPTEENERPIREWLRKEHGPGAFALLNIPKFDALLEEGNVVGDGLYSWAEYKILKEKYGEVCVVIAVYAPPQMRYARLKNRKLLDSDKDLRRRPSSFEQAKARDYAELENLAKGAPIAMADFTIMNTSSVSSALNALEKIIKIIENN